MVVSYCCPLPAPSPSYCGGKLTLTANFCNLLIKAECWTPRTSWQSQYTYNAGQNHSIQGTPCRGRRPSSLQEGIDCRGALCPYRPYFNMNTHKCDQLKCCDYFWLFNTESRGSSVSTSIHHFSLFSSCHASSYLERNVFTLHVSPEAHVFEWKNSSMKISKMTLNKLTFEAQKYRHWNICKFPLHGLDF